MPGPREVEHYLAGLWLLLRQDPDGLRYLDLTDRGALRSFWTIVYAAPSVLLSWIWWRMTFLAGMPIGAKAGGLFFFRLALIEAVNWIVPLVLVGFLAWGLGIGSKFAGIVVAANWLALPFSYLYGALILLLLLIPGLAASVVLLWFLLLLTMVIAYVRVLKMICGGHLLTAATITAVLLVPAIVFSSFLERFLGVVPG